MDSSTFNLSGYLHIQHGLFPSQYAAAVAVLGGSLVIGAIIDYFYRGWRLNSGKRPMNILLIPLLAMTVGGASFVVWDNNPNQGGLYTANYYDSAVNTDIATWANRSYRIDVTPDQASTFKYVETGGFLGDHSVSYPRVRFPGSPGTVKLHPVVNHGKITLLYIDGSGHQKPVPPYKAQ